MTTIRKTPSIEEMIANSNIGGSWGKLVRMGVRSMAVGAEFEAIVAALVDIDPAQTDAEELRADVARRFTISGVQFVADPPTRKGTVVDFVVGRVGIMIETGGSGTRTAQRLRDIDPNRRLVGFVVIGPCGLKGRQPLAPMLVIEPPYAGEVEP